MIHRFFKDQLFGLHDAVKNVWLVIVISVGADTQKLFLGVGGLFESVVDTHDRVGWSRVDGSPQGELSGGLHDQSAIFGHPDSLGKHLVKEIKIINKDKFLAYKWVNFNLSNLSSIINYSMMTKVR